MARHVLAGHTANTQLGVGAKEVRFHVGSTTINRGRIAVTFVAALSVLSFARSAEARHTDSRKGVPSSIRHYESVNDIVQQSFSAGRKQINFRTLGKSFSLELEPNNIFASNAKDIW